MTLSPTQIHEQLDTKGLLDDAHGPGAYSLRVNTPDSVEGVARAFLSVVDHPPDADTLKRLTSNKVLYVGASGNIYDRLQEHGEGKARKALLLEAFEATEVFDVWPSDEPEREERHRARELSASGFVCWANGELW